MNWITDVRKTRNHGYDVIYSVKSYLLITPITLANCHTNPNSNQQALDATSFFPRWWDAYRKQLGLKDFSPKSQDVMRHCSRLRSAALPMIDRGDIRQVTTHGTTPVSLPGAGYGQFEHKADSLIAKFKEAGGTVREIDVYEQSHRHSALVICIIVRSSWAVNHYRDNAITYKAQRDKNARELKLANAAITDMQMRQRDVIALDAKYTKELADATS